MGHVINASIPNSCRKTVVQRKDIDGFYGTLFEGDFATAINAKSTDREKIIFDPKLRRLIPWKVKIAGKEIKAYEPVKGKDPMHPTVQIQESDGEMKILH